MGFLANSHNYLILILAVFLLVVTSEIIVVARKRIKESREEEAEAERESPEGTVSLKEVIDVTLAPYLRTLRLHDVSVYYRHVEKISLNWNRLQLEKFLLDLLRSSVHAVEALPEKWIEISAYRTGDRIQVSFLTSGPHTSFILDLPIRDS
jgi:C4-dicarboxylate-specific signal transduction histidine kinase